MNRLMLVTSFVLATATTSVAQENVAQTLMAHEQAWAQAQRANDAKAIDALLAPDFVFIVDSTGALQSRAEYIADFLKSKIPSFDVTDMKVQVHGNAAVVTGIAAGKGLDPAGKPLAFRVRFADTFVKMPDGRWQAVASASVPIK